MEIWCNSFLGTKLHKLTHSHVHLLIYPLTQSHTHTHTDTYVHTHTRVELLCLCLYFSFLSQHTVYISVYCAFVIMLMSFPFFVIIIWWPSRHCAPLLLTPSVNPSCRFRCSSFIFVNIFSWMPAGYNGARSEISRHGIVEIDALDAQL